MSLLQSASMTLWYIWAVAVERNRNGRPQQYGQPWCVDRLARHQGCWRLLQTAAPYYSVESMSKSDSCWVAVAYQVIWSGAKPNRHLNTRNAILHFSLCQTGNQWTCHITGVMRSDILVPSQLVFKAACLAADHVQCSQTASIQPLRSALVY